MRVTNSLCFWRRGEHLGLRDSWAPCLWHFCRSLMLKNSPRS